MSPAEHSCKVLKHRESVPMVGAALVLLFCLLVGLLSLVVCGWVVISGQLFIMDGILLILISLLVGGIFVANFAWSVHTGEFRQILDHLRHGSKSAAGTGAPPPGSPHDSSPSDR